MQSGKIIGSAFALAIVGFYMVNFVPDFIDSILTESTGGEYIVILILVTLLFIVLIPISSVFTGGK